MTYIVAGFALDQDDRNLDERQLQEFLLENMQPMQRQIGKDP